MSIRARVQTVSGRAVDLLAVKPHQIAIEDIAHGLAHLCRFNGHTRDFYSVAQHAVLVSMCCRPADMLHGLLHDASEAYLGDVVSPLKHLPRMKGYRATENRLQRAIYVRFGLAPLMPDSVKRVDAQMLATEIRDLMPTCTSWPRWVMDTKALCLRIVPLPPADAERWFLGRFTQLIALRKGKAA
jgi:5'-deoxynucleotidase YfbR-like HD superfamily hydrolase